MGVSATENPKCPLSWPSICGMPHLCPRFPSLQPTNLSPQQVRKGSPAQAGVLGTGSQPFALRMADRELKSTSLVRAALESDGQLVGHRGRGRPSSKLTLFNQRNHERQKAQEVGLRATLRPCYEDSATSPICSLLFRGGQQGLGQSTNPTIFTR